MLINTEFVDIPLAKAGMRASVASPRSKGKYGGILCYSDIFQLTGSMLRMCARIAGYGFCVVAPEIFHRLEAPGSAIPFDDEGRARGLNDAASTDVSEFDHDCRAALNYISERPDVSWLGTVGFCIGGHLAFRAAMQPDVRAATCFYGTGIHDGKLGKDPDSKSLERASEIKGKLLMIFGSADPHIPEEGRNLIKDALDRAGTAHSIKLYNAEHAFMRDEGPRYDPEATDQAFSDMIDLFRQV